MQHGNRRAVFLDRDGVINPAVVRGGRPYPPPSVEAWEPVPGAAKTLQRLRQAGFHLIVVTNQPDVATGLQRREIVEAIHARMRTVLPLDDVRVCYHADVDDCGCRKPKPGLLFDAARDWALDLGQSVMVGDRWRDIEAGKAAGCWTILIDHGYAERRAEGPGIVVHSLVEAGEVICRTWEARQPSRGGS